MAEPGVLSGFPSSLAHELFASTLIIFLLGVYAVLRSSSFRFLLLKRRSREQAREAKRARLAQGSTLESLPVDEQEQLALFLLRNKN